MVSFQKLERSLEKDGLLVSENCKTRDETQYAENVSCLYAVFLAKIIVDSVFLCGEGGALFPLKANNTLSNKIKKSEPSFYFFLF